jgi:hypothetical protein
LRCLRCDLYKKAMNEAKLTKKEMT